MRIALVSAAVAIIAVLTFAAFYNLVVIPERCARAVAVGENDALTAFNASEPVYGMRAARRSIEALQGCECRVPLDVNVPVVKAIAYRAQKRYEEAVTEYQTALKIDRRPEIYFGLGAAQLELGKRKEAAEAFYLACAFDPTMLDDIPDGLMRVDVASRLGAK